MTSEPQRERDWRPAIVSAIAALALYALTLGGTYVYDDRYILQADPRVSDVSRWGQFWTKDYFNGGADNLYRPLVSMTYAIQVKLHGNGERAAWAFHLVNWLLHAAVAAAVAELGRRMTNSSAVALIAGVLFAVHPIHVEAVANIIGRAELMCGLGMIGALVLYMRPLSIGRAVAIWACFLVALLSKEQGMLLPLLVLIATPLRGTKERNALLVLVILLVWTSAAYIYVRENTIHLKFWWDRGFLDPVINPILKSEGRDRWLMPLALLGRYVELLIVPWRLCPDYGGKIIGSIIGLCEPYLWIGILAAVGGIVAIIVAATKRAWNVLLCLIAFALLFGMVSNHLTLIGVNLAERLMYIPSAFVCIAVAMLLGRLPRRAMISIISIAVALFCLRTATYAWQWNDRLRLYRYSADQWPQSVRLRMLLAEELAERGALVSAENEITTARAIQPDYYKVWIRSATIALQQGRLEEAMTYARRAHRLQPTLGSLTLMNEIRARHEAATRRSTTQP